MQRRIDIQEINTATPVLFCLLLFFAKLREIVKHEHGGFCG